MFSERLRQAIAQAARFERSLPLPLIDMDGFKFVNDTLGHNAADTVLDELAARLRSILREGDVLERMGDDEFVVLIEEFSEPAEVAEVAKRVLEIVSRPFAIQAVVSPRGEPRLEHRSRGGPRRANPAWQCRHRGGAGEGTRQERRFCAEQMSMHRSEREKRMLFSTSRGWSASRAP